MPSFIDMIITIHLIIYFHLQNEITHNIVVYYWFIWYTNGKLSWYGNGLDIIIKLILKNHFYYYNITMKDQKQREN